MRHPWLAVVAVLVVSQLPRAARAAEPRVAAGPSRAARAASSRGAAEPRASEPRVAAVVEATPAPRAAMATADDVAHEGLPHVLDTSLLGQYARSLGDPPARLENLGTFVTRTRLALGRNVTYCAGLDSEIGGSSRGLVYGVTGYLVGLGARWGEGNTVSLCGGVGYDGVRHAIPHAVRFPVELSAAVALGPLRPILYLRPSWLVGGRERLPGGPTGFGKELEAGLVVRLGAQHHYWTTANAGGGLAIGVGYREVLDSRYLAFSVGVNLVGAQ